MESNGILIPQNVTVEIGLFDYKRDMETMMGVEGADKNYYYFLKKIFELNKDVAVVENKKTIFPKVEVEIPNDIDRRYKVLSLFTNIQVV